LSIAVPLDLIGTSSFFSQISTFSNAPGFGATAMMVLIRSTGRKRTVAVLSFSETADNTFFNSSAISVGRPFFVSNSRTR
jgi:hypothetical protein